MGFPITIICTLQGTSVTQGNATVFTGNKFAVYYELMTASRIFGYLKQIFTIKIFESLAKQTYILIGAVRTMIRGNLLYIALGKYTQTFDCSLKT